MAEKEYIEREAAISKLRLVAVREAHINFPAAMLAELKSIPAADVVERPRWIPVEERLPEEENAHVLVWCPRFRNIFLAYVHDGEWRFVGYRGSDNVNDTIYGSITHWMPLPEPPEPPEEVE